MKILFMGQKGIPGRVQDEKVGRERRVEAIATLLVTKGHQVFVTCAKPYVSANLTKINGINLVHRSSWLPDEPGGWWYNLLSALSMGTVKPEVVHAQGWRAAVVVSLAIVLRPETTYIWTVDKGADKHERLAKFVARMISGLFDAVTTPSRELQHKMLYKYNVRAVYVPDGYDDSDNVPVLPLKQFGLRTSGYTLLTAGKASEVRLTAKTYKKAGWRRKMVVLAEERGPFKRLKREFPWLHCVGQQSGRGLHSLIKEAGLIVLQGKHNSVATVLDAMDSGKAIVLVGVADYQAVLGVSTMVVKENDGKGLADVLIGLVRDEKRRLAVGRKARKRARAHFTWRRILPEYIELYHYPLLKIVPIDSVVPKIAVNKQVEEQMFFA